MVCFGCANRRAMNSSRSFRSNGWAARIGRELCEVGYRRVTVAEVFPSSVALNFYFTVAKSMGRGRVCRFERQRARRLHATGSIKFSRHFPGFTIDAHDAAQTTRGLTSVRATLITSDPAAAVRSSVFVGKEERIWSEMIQPRASFRLEYTCMSFEQPTLNRYEANKQTNKQTKKTWSRSFYRTSNYKNRNSNGQSEGSMTQFMRKR